MQGSASSKRAKAVHGCNKAVFDYYANSRYAERKGEPGICDFTFGNPHEMPLPGLVEVLRRSVEPRTVDWYAYKTSEPEARQVVADALTAFQGVTFEAEDVAMTNGGFAALAVALQLLADPGDEVVYSLPPWFCYEPMALSAGLTPVKVSVREDDFDLDLDAIEGAITKRTRIVIVNTPHNPTGRIYPDATLRALADVLGRASRWSGRRIWLLADEPYNRIVFDGRRFSSPALFYPWTLIAYSYGKVLLAPGQRLGYLAFSPLMPDRDRQALREVVPSVQIALGWAFPNAVMQYAVSQLEGLSIEVQALQRKRDRMVEALRAAGYDLVVPEGTFYLMPRTPIDDDVAFAEALADRDVFVVPGRLLEMPGHFRLCLTATEEMVERSLPVFEDVFRSAVGRRPEDNPASWER